MEDYNNMEDIQSNDLMKQLMNLASDIKERSKPSSCGINILKQSNNNYNDINKEFFKAIVLHYTNNLQGGYNGKRQIKTKFVSSVSDDLSEHGIHDSFVKSNYNQSRVDTVESNDQQDDTFEDDIEHSRRPYRNKEATDLYKKILEKLENVLGVEPETAKLYRLALKIYVTNKNPELKARKNDLLKMQEINNLITTKQDLDKIFKTMDINSIRKYMEEREKENKNKFNNKNAITTSEKTTPENTNSTPEKTKNKPVVKVSEQSSEQNTENKKSKTKKNKKNDETGGYLQSSEIIFSPE